MLALAIVGTAGGAGFAAGSRIASDGPDEGSVDVGFARDMAIHHAQAVQLSELVRNRTDDEQIRRLAADVALTQQAQIGQMRGWLDAWGRSPTATGPVMGWMGDPVPADEMPGLADDAEVEQLAELAGDDAEVLYLQLLHEHHAAGVAMADAAAEAASEREVRDLAGAISRSQSSELDAIAAMLQARGAVVPQVTAPHEAEH